MIVVSVSREEFDRVWNGLTTGARYSSSKLEPLISVWDPERRAYIVPTGEPR